MYYSKSFGTRIKVRKELLIWGFVLILMAAIAVGEVEQGPIIAQADETIEAIDFEVAGDENVVAMEESDLPLGQDDSIGKPIQSITFKKEMLVRDALRFLAAKYQKNIVPSASVNGQLAFTSLYNVTFEEAMDAILGPSFKYEQIGQLTKVYSKEEYKKIMADKDRMIEKVITLYYISAAEAMRLISPVLSSAGVIQGSSPAATVVPTGESISSGSSSGDAMALNDTIVLVDYPENIAKAQELLKQLDRRPQQVLVEATILSATLSEETALGIDWSSLNGVAIDTVANIGSGVADGVATGGFASAVKTSVSSGGLNAGLTNDHVAVLIRALESVTDVTILANPKILALNKQLGQVYIGNKIGYVSQTTQTDTSTTQAVEFLETGTKLSFRPYIGADGYIRMDIQPKDSSGLLKTNSIPDESSTELATNIMVKDGQTVVIGGLFRDVINTTRNQVPVLGDIPFVGTAFRGTTDVTERQEVIVMLTPHIIEEPDEVSSEARVEDLSRKRFGAQKGLQWVDRAKLAGDFYSKAAQYYIEGNKEAALKELETSLELRPAYLEALRLQEKIMGEMDPSMKAKMRKNVLGAVEAEDSYMWQRR